MKEDLLKELREAPYPLFSSPRSYSFDLNEDILEMLHEEYSAESIVSKLAEAIKGKTPSEAEKIGQEIFGEYGRNWMRRTMQLSEEYPDRTIEMVLETIDRQGNQFLIFPHVPQRYVEIAYLGTQEFLKLPVILNNQYEFIYRVPQCVIFNTIKDRCGEEVANLMTCKSACLTALDTIRQNMELTVAINMSAATAKEGYCEFSMKKL